jgi:hypothetical protein
MNATTEANLAEAIRNGSIGTTEIMDAILAAGYRKPRTITMVEELDALPVGSVVLDGDVGVRRDDGYWKLSDLAGVYASSEITLPATVLYEPEPQP